MEGEIDDELVNLAEDGDDEIGNNQQRSGGVTPIFDQSVEDDFSLINISDVPK